MLANNVDWFVIKLTFVLLGAAGIVTSCTHPIGSQSNREPAQKAPRLVPTNSLAFQLQSLGRTLTEEEHEVIETALALMQRYQIRTDSPLRSIWHDNKANEWSLKFENGDPDGTFTIFLHHPDADTIDIQFTMLASRRLRYAPKKLK